jgi:hypothetical protein
MVFDTWGGALTPADYRDFSLRYMQQIVDSVTREAEGRRVAALGSQAALFRVGRAGDRERPARGQVRAAGRAEPRDCRGRGPTRPRGLDAGRD